MFSKKAFDKILELTIMDALFDPNGNIVKDADTKALNELIILTEEDIPTSTDDYPF